MDDWGKREQRTDRRLSRRKLLGGTAGATGSLWLFAALAGCQPSMPAAPSPASAATASTGTSGATAPTASPATASSAPTTAPATQPKATTAAGATPVVQLSYATDWTTGARGDIREAAVAQFEKENPKYKVKVEPIGGDYYDKLAIEISGGTASDIMLFNGLQFLNFQRKGAFAAIDPYLKDLNVDMKDYTVIAGVFLADGKQYGMPFQLTVATWYANVDMFQKAGVPLPKDGWNWNDLLGTAQKLTKPDQKQWGILMPNSLTVAWGPLMLSAGGNFFNKDNTKTAFADGDGFEGFKFAVEMVTKYKVSPSPAESKSMTTPQTSDVFAQGHVAMTTGNSAAVANYTSLVKDRFHWQPMPQPVYPKTHQLRTTYNGQPNIVNKNAKDVEGAVKFVVFMAGEFVQGLIADARGSTPVLLKLQKSDRYLKAPPTNMEEINTTYGKAEDLKFNADWLEWYNAVLQATDLAFIGEATPEEAFKKAIEAGDKALAKG